MSSTGCTTTDLTRSHILIPMHLNGMCDDGGLADAVAHPHPHALERDVRRRTDAVAHPHPHLPPCMHEMRDWSHITWPGLGMPPTHPPPSRLPPPRRLTSAS